MKQIKVGVLGAGGLGKAAASVLAHKKEMMMAAICDTRGIAYSAKGLNGNILDLPFGETVASLKEGEQSGDSIGDMIDLVRSKKVEALFMALPNLPNEFYPSVVRRFLKARASCVFSDALKRTQAAKLMLQLDRDIKKTRSVYMLGCGATPGLLTAAAVVAAQSFVKVEKIKIWWGVGVSNWEAFRATIREDIAHLPGYDVKSAGALSDGEVDKLLDERNGKLELFEMEHADDLLLERAGVVSKRSQVTVGGVMDTRSEKKPVTTTMTLTGITYEGKRSTHTFQLGDETSMSANVIGPALGYLKRALWLKEHGIYGIFGSTEHMPMVVK